MASGGIGRDHHTRPSTPCQGFRHPPIGGIPWHPATPRLPSIDAGAAQENAASLLNRIVAYLDE
jgi:hypothetical protein